MSKQASKEIQVLSDFEHILMRSSLYVGSVKISEETLPIVRNGKIYAENRKISVGMYKLFDEIFSNCVDEAKRMKKPMSEITINIDSKTNRVSISDAGDGFANASAKNSKSGLSNVETAVSILRSGSNFDNDGISETLIGTNGFGMGLVAALSTDFTITTTNSKESYSQNWIEFKSSKPEIKKGKHARTGTSISFTPRPDIFDSCVWDKDILYSTLLLKKRVLETEAKTKSLKIKFHWDGREIPITSDLPNYLSYQHDLGEILITKSFEGSGTFSYVNSAICTGVHIKIIQDQINKVLEDTLGHHFYDMLVILNLPPIMVRFGDQNKTKFVSKREEVEPSILHSIGPKLVQFYRTDVFKEIKKFVDQRKRSEEIKKIRKERKNVNVKFSHKYFPSASRNPETLFIVEGLSASGSILQKRQPQKEAVYALKGKIKNARSLGDLSSNKEILELMQILNLDPENSKLECPFKKVVIATDADCLAAGTHIPTYDGIKKIEDVIPGDKILTPDGKYETVLRIQSQLHEKSVLIRSGDLEIECSNGHIFPISKDGEFHFVTANNLSAGDLLVGYDDNIIPIDSVSLTDLENPSEFYDIEIGGDHVFYISDATGETKILTHNCDGYHIRSLLINLFNAWFPWMVEQGKIYMLETPIASVGDRAKKYFYSMEDFLAYKGQKTHVRYLKGLGSLSISDWEHVMENKFMNRIQKDPQSNKNLEMAFGKLSSLRKDWLSAKS